MKRIIAVVSVVKPDAQTEHYRYDIAGHTGEVEGKQTNEAPIKVLLTLHPDIEEVIAIVTDAAAQEREHLGGLSSYGYLEQHIRAEFPRVSFFPIPSGNTLDFNGTLLPEILGRVDSNDVIYLETTGGFRDTVTDLMQLSQVLTYQGITVERAVYSNFYAKPKKRVEDVTHSYRSFSLISGLNEFQRYGSVDSLQTYLESFPQPPQELAGLIDSMKKVYDSLSMCRISEMENNIAEFRSKLEAAKHSEALKSSDPLLYQLLDLFEKKYPQLENTYAQVQWCLDNNLIQQALTIFNERIPKYLITNQKYLSVTVEDGDFLRWTEDVHAHYRSIKAPKSEDYYRRPEYEQLNYLLHLSPRTKAVKGDVMGKSIDRLAEVLKDTPYQVHQELTPDSLKPILRDFLFAQTLRNAVNHAAEEAGGSLKRLDYLSKNNYPVEALYSESEEDLDLPAIKKRLKAALERLSKLAGKTNRKR